MTNKTQPAVKYSLRETPDSIWVEIMDGETHVATIPYKTIQQREYAARIVKCVNMHDELIDRATTALAMLEDGAHSTAKSILKQLLTLASQK